MKSSLRDDKRASALGSPIQQRIPAIVLSFLAVCAAACALLSAPRGGSEAEIWKGYRTVLVDIACPESEVLAALAAAGFKTVISLSTEPVSISNWVKLETTTLGALHERLIEGDPRRDGYIDSLGAWFSASVDRKPYRSYFIPTSARLFPRAALERALSVFEGRYVLPDSGSEKHSPQSNWALPWMFSISLLVGATLAGAVGDPKAPSRRFFAKFFVRLAVAAPWAVAAAGGLPMAAVASLWGIALIDFVIWLDLPLEEFRRFGSWWTALDSLRHQTRPPLMLALSAAGSLFFAPAALPSVGLALASSFFVIVAYALMATGSTASRLRFVPKPIAIVHRRQGAAPSWIAGCAMATVALWMAATLAPRGATKLPEGSAIFPTPVRIAGNARPGPEEARSRSSARKAGTVPGLDSWLVHRATQEALPLERLGGARDDPFAPVTVSRPGGAADSLRFDDEWARSAYRSIPEASVEGMLAAQVFAVAAEPRSGSGSSRPLAPIDALLYIFLLIPPLGRIAAGLSVSRGLSSSETQQEA